MVLHYLEYSPSSRAKCQGDYPCKGSLIQQGVLRYGKQFERSRREYVKWRHWECVTPDILRAIGRAGVESATGWHTLSGEDKDKVRQAIKDKTVHSAVARSTASTSSSSQTTEKKKRKASFVKPSFVSTSATTSRAVIDAPAPRVPDAIYPPTASQMIEVAEEAEVDNQEEEEPPERLYATLSTSIVGVQYYKGLVGYGEQVKLVREPRNPYDRNAIQVLNINNVQVGHVPRNVAAKLAPLLDQGKVTVEGEMLEGNSSGFKYSLMMNVKIYGRADRGEILEPLLVWATPGQRGFGSSSSQHRNAPATQTHARAAPAQTSYRDPYPVSYNPSQHAQYAPALTPAQEAAQKKLAEDTRKAVELRQILDGLEKVNDEGRRANLLDQLLSSDDVLTLPEHPNPPGIEAGNLTVNLLRHQKQALLWCIDRENPVPPKSEADHPVQFWQLKRNNGKPFYFNLATKTPQEAPPELGRGALCADSMGLGKTLTMIALILATKSDPSPGFADTTLIVVPLSVLSNWQSQIDEHCAPGALTYVTYYGANRNLGAEELRKYDVVLTTYQTVVGDHSGGSKVVLEGSSKRKKTESTLMNIQWKRVIIDEGHQIRNPSTKAAIAVSALTAERRWALTGTPILNSPKDLGSLLTFLKICRPMDQPDFFNQAILRPLKHGGSSGAELLRGIMSQICIRRTKEMQDSEGNTLVPLPPVDMIVVPVALNPKERELYDAVEEVSRGKVEGLLRTGGLSFSTGALSMLTRLRQLALHPGLIPRNYLEQLKMSEDEGQEHGVIQVTPAERVRLQGLLFQAMEDNEECPICFGVLADPRITPCTHTYCFPCISEAISRDPRCPMDRRSISLGTLIEPPPITFLTQAPVRSDDDDETLDDLRAGSSAKVDQLVHLLRLTPSTDKSLVFSQFTSFLDKVGDALDAAGVEYCRFDGRMSAKRRAETIAKFSVPIKAAPTADEESAGISSRLRHLTQSQPQPMEIGDGGDDGSDFAPDDDQSSYGDTEPDNDEEPRYKRNKGKGKKKAKGKAPAKSRVLEALEELDGGSNPRVMLISLKAGALGLNLTVANNVFLMDPWWQEGIESQAIDRCNRIGQTKPVHVYQLIAENTVESKVLEIQEKKKNLVKEAFSGMKNKETPRQRREARLQEIIALFGIQAGGQPSGLAS